ncbi:acyltransferase [Metallumcola ferriviriculae]|uniref:Chloramphenicol acetyltransferase n=1 Tax=Metallumcola ferriviriculae TaxID=3039180 RepID=A0AAU0UWB5_9FIRM|nr:acyltransferase [Desulfitibacteraceae bacterium MK1]
MFKCQGKNINIFDRAKIVYPENIELGSNVIIDDFVLIVAKKRIVIGNNVHIASFTSITGNEEFIAEDFSAISSGCRIFTSTDDYSGAYLSNPTVPDKYKNVFSAPVVIKKYSLVGANSVILPGSIIEEGVSIGANSLVKGLTEPYCLYVGNPIKKIRHKDEKQFKRLEKDYLSRLQGKK